MFSLICKAQIPIEKVLSSYGVDNDIVINSFK